MWIAERPEILRNKQSQSVYSENGQRRRRYHFKSRNGCTSCRARRIKCNEERPSCDYCLRTKKSCIYHLDIRASTSNQRPSDAASDAWLINGCVQGQVLRALEDAELDPDLADFQPALRLHALESLNHFVTCDLSWLKARKIQILMQRPATALVTSHPYLLHAVLAISSAHLAVLKSEQSTLATTAQLHWQHSLRLFSARFDHDLENEDVDAIYFASQLHALLSFLLVRLPLAQYDHTWSADWLVALRYKYVLFNTPVVVERLRLGIWRPLVEAHYNWLERSRKQLTKNIEHVPSNAIEALINFTEDSCQPMKDFQEHRLQYLIMLERKPPIADAIGAFLSFITESPAEYITSLQEKDTLSLLLLLYWCKIVSKVDQWWLSRAAEAERANIYTFLSSLSDPGIATAIEALNR